MAKPLYFIISFLLLSSHLLNAQRGSNKLSTAQPDTLVEQLLDIATNPTVNLNVREGINQHLGPFEWHERLLEKNKPIVGGAGTPHITRPMVMRTVMANPGKLHSYRSLNIFYFLEDWQAFNNCFRLRGYQSATPAARRRVRQRRISDRGLRPDLVGPDGRVIADLQNNDFPVVRQYVMGTDGIAVNPKYFTYPKIPRNQDFDYLQPMNTARDMKELYRSALVDRTTENVYIYGLPDLYYTEYRSTLLQRVKALRLALLNKIQEAAKQQLVRQGRSYPSNRDMTQTEMNFVHPNLVGQPLPSNLTATFNQVNQTLQQSAQPFFTHLNRIKEQKAKVLPYLSAEEQAFFTWLERQSLLMLEPVSASMVGLRELTISTPQNATYGKLMVLTEILHLTEERLSGPSTNDGVTELLQKITYQYYLKVRKAENVFYEMVE